MGFAASQSGTVLSRMQRAAATGFKDSADAIRESRTKALHELGKVGVRYLDKSMPRPTLTGWSYSIESKGKTLSVVWRHARATKEVTQHGKKKYDRKRGRYVTVQDVINMLDVGTPGHGPYASKRGMEFKGKYGYENRGNAFNEDGEKVWLLQHVRGIKAHNFFAQLKAYLKNRGTYWVELNGIANIEFEAILTGRRRKGFMR